MKLTEQTKTKLRNIIINEVKNVPDGKRIKLDKDLLDELIFFYGSACMKDSDYMTGFKVPIWTGDFLSKIDLSELDFNGVFSESIDFFNSSNYILTKETQNRLKSFNVSDNVFKSINFPYIINDENFFTGDNLTFVNFSNTNIKIDFSHIFSNYLVGWNLSGVDLSDSNLKIISGMERCNLSNTNICADDVRFLEYPSDVTDHVYFNIWNTDFSNNNLSGINYFMENYKSTGHNNFSNTGVKFVYPEDFRENVESKCVDMDLKNNFLVGCYINGVLVKEGQTIDDIFREQKKMNTINYENEEQLILDLPSIIESQLKSANYTEKNKDFISEETGSHLKK